MDIDIFRISLTLACPMDLRLYPLDKQVCVLQIASYGWATDDLVYKWKDVDPVQIVPGLHLPRFTLEQYKSAYCNVITNTGEYSCLKVELIFKREFSYYLITIYVPCCMLVIVSWVSFWLDQNAIPARLSLGVTTLLTMSTQTSGISAQLPPVSYTKAIDVWTGACQGFVFCALLEFALVNYASRSDMQRERARERIERARRQWEVEHTDNNHTNNTSSLPSQHSQHSEHSQHSQYTALLSMQNGGEASTPRVSLRGYPIGYPHPPSYMNQSTPLERPCEIHLASKGGFGCYRTKSLLSKFASRAKRIDVISRFIFPLLFAIFNLAYWLYYLLAKGSNEDFED
ncbi:glutamate-gated chloride channel [Eurytemora carolleeae]|uniref:glutamate-gated chloride channel n=1 Tax=Eurytemora carolleeae TaxID=1294199 RepID=UPI000C77A6FA|nr:glutamate-gated chloride channel [Eurytemora carolleeae]|eukprot:XP_023319739.1 glutamate-gated chloride channel-like [Eurytemora affinis]